MKIILMAITLLFFFSSCHQPDAKKLINQDNFTLRDYELFWSDEFNGAKIDTNKWKYKQLGKRRDAINTPKNASVKNGVLEIKTTTKNGKFFTSMLSTKNKFDTRFGYFECRVKLQKQIGHWSAFWLQSPKINRYDLPPKKAGAEIDVFEYLARKRNSVQQTLHWGGYRKNHKVIDKLTKVPNLNKGWHTFGVLWEKDKYIFYINGKKTWTITDEKLISHQKQYLILSLEVGKWAGDIKKAKLPDSFFVDYVRVYKKK